MDQKHNTNKIMPEGVIPKSSNRSGKLGLLFGLSLAAIIAEWFLTKIALYGHRDLMFWIYPAAAASLTIGFLTLFFAVNYHQILRWLLGVLSLGTYLAIMPKNPYVILGGVIFFVFLFWFEARIRAEERERQDFSIRRVARASIDIMVYALLLLLGLNIYYNTQVQFSSDPDRFYNQLGNSVSKSASFLFGEQNSPVNVDQSLDQYLEAQVSEDEPEFVNLEPNQKQSLLQAARDQFLRKFNISVAGAEPLSQVLAQIAVEKIKSSVGRYEFLFPLIFTLVILALLRTFAFLFTWFTVALTWLIFKILLRLRFFNLARVQVEVEKLEI